MEDPKRDIADVIHALTNPNSYEKQKATVQTYFVSDAAFDHPLCKVAHVMPSHGLSGSQELVLGVYQWYRVLFKDVKLEVGHITFDKELNRLFVEIHQACTFRILPIPGRTASVDFITVIDVQKGRHSHQRINMNDASLDVNNVTTGGDDRDELWYIKKQNDMYQSDQWVHFLVPYGKQLIQGVKMVVGVGCTIGAKGGRMLGIWG